MNEAFCGGGRKGLDTLSKDKPELNKAVSAVAEAAARGK